MNKESALKELTVSWGESPAHIYEIGIKCYDRMCPGDHEHQGEDSCLDWASSEEVPGNTP